MTDDTISQEPELPNLINEWQQFEQRKLDHIRLAMDTRSQVESGAGFDRIKLWHEALPELNLAEIDLSVNLWGQQLSSPIFVSSMTSGHRAGENLNLLLASACAKRRWALGCGSQRRELTDPDSHREWLDIRQKFPELFLMGNLGISQVIQTDSVIIQRLVERLNLQALIIHTNPLQECLQPEGSPEFRGAYAALRRCAQELSVPVVLKETGCGISATTLQKLLGSKLAAVDVSGMGGTHWGRIEGLRSPESDVRARIFKKFSDWGITTVESLLAAKKMQLDYQVWASGGVRSGVDAAKALALGAHMVGVAQPVLKAAQGGFDGVWSAMEELEFELKIAMFCTGAAKVTTLREKERWRPK